MPQEKIKLGKPETLPSGKVRWRKSYNKQPWKSSAYDQESRRNRSLAWQEFIEWREKIKAKIEQEQTADVDLQALPKEGFGSLRDIALQNLGLTDFQATEARKNTAESEVYETSKLIDQWLVFRLSDVRSKEITAGTLDNNRNQLQKFADFCPNILHADGMKFLEFRAKLQDQIAEGASEFTARDTLTTTKNFLEWCGDTAKVIEPISNLRKRGTGIRVPKKRIIKIWSDEAVEDLFRVVDGPKRLFYLLMLNSGCYEGDVGTWRHTATDDKGKTFNTFDPEARTIRFKRRKERDEEGVPTVTYRLWDETFELLEKYRSNHPEYLLTSEDNTVLYIEELHNDKTKKNKRKRKNLIGRQFGRYRTKLKKKDFWGTLEDLRKTAITKLDGHDEFARYAQYFAGHSPRTITDQFYRVPSQDRFNAAVAWLGEQFGFPTTAQ
ncbi:site-specific integrase [Thalassoroseus pseudoceratinae]|uniref:hypothetical protein n=1 Tax=Thalassoroseus pseudoceratinae TaxID=2713176 RepID=UPI001422D8C9|nr:hypothetical protein [Thalassoroseus pseudoceratinae]